MLMLTSKMMVFHVFVSFTLLKTCLMECDNNYKLYKHHKMYQIQGSKEDMVELENFFLDNPEIPYQMKTEKGYDVLISPDLAPFVDNITRTKALTSRVVLHDFSKLFRNEKKCGQHSEGFSWTAYYDVDDIYGYLQNMSHQHPEWVQVVVGGQSYEGRQILGLRINTPTDDDKSVMFIESGAHAREWITSATTTYFINELLTSSDPEIISLRDQFDWHIFPTVNPDGYHYSYTKDRMWRKTRSRSANGCYGANPNLNWNYHWMDSSNNPCSYRLYAGSGPFSEIETRTLSEYISGLENMLGYIAYHSAAQMLLFPFSGTTEHVDNYDDLKIIGETSLRYGYAVNKEKYKGPGCNGEISYKVAGGSIDWVRYSKGTPIVFLYELRGEYFYWPPSRIYEQGDEVTQMMVGLVKAAHKLGYVEEK